jgi:hypothetical protein
LTADEVARIRALRAAGRAIGQIAAETGRATSTVSRVFSGEIGRGIAARTDTLAERLARVAAMAAEGRGKIEAVRAELRCNYLTALRLMRQAGHSPRPYRPVTEFELRVIKDLRSQGLGAVRIGRALGKSPSTVGRILALFDAENPTPPKPRPARVRVATPRAAPRAAPDGEQVTDLMRRLATRGETEGEMRAAGLTPAQIARVLELQRRGAGVT